MARKKSKVTIELADPRMANVDTAPDHSKIKQAVEQAAKKEKTQQPAILISRLNHPEYVQYQGETLVVSPRARLNVDASQLKMPLPSGLLVKKLK